MGDDREALPGIERTAPTCCSRRSLPSSRASREAWDDFFGDEYQN